MSDTAYTVEREENPPYGRYVIHLPPDAEAEMVYRWSADHAMVITHTEVPQEFGGKGIAGHLVRAAIADARAQGFRITPLCSYVAAQFRRNPDWQDLLA
ncbi:MAG: N-acetyltransferase [Rhizobiales bacterium]|nr:N-acetyltransferase [Hyphomicrobiales bacterium]